MAALLNSSLILAGENQDADETATITPGGSNRYLRVKIFQSDGSPPGVDVVKYGGSGGTSLSLVHDTGVVQSFLRILTYDLVAPSTGGGTVYVEFPASCSEYVIEVEAWEDVDQGDPYDAMVDDDGTGFTPQPTINVPSTTTDHVVVSDVYRLSASTQDSDESGQTDIEQDGVGSVVQATSSQRPGQASSTDMSYTDSGAGTVSNWQWVIQAQALNGSGGAGAPVITDVNTTDEVQSASAGNLVNGTGFDTAEVFIEQGAVSVEQDVVGQDATEIEFDYEEGSTDQLKHGAATLIVTNADTQEDSINIDILPPTGQLYIDLASINTTSAYRITASPDLEIGDQLQARGVGGGAVPTGLNLYSDATFGFNVGETPAAFDVRAWDHDDATWGSWATQSVETNEAAGAIALGAIAVAGATHITDPAAGAITLGRVAVAGATKITQSTSAALVLGPVAVAGTGITGKSAAGAITLGPVAVAGATHITAPAAGAITLGPVTVAGATHISQAATGAIMLGPIAVAGAGTPSRSTSGAVTLGAVQVEGVAVSFSGVVAAGSITLGPIAVAGAGAASRVAAGAVTLGRIGVAGAGSAARQGAGAIMLGSIRVQGYEATPIPALYQYRDGTGFDEAGRMLTHPLGAGEPVPGSAHFIQGLAHGAYGVRYVTSWGGAVKRIEGFAVRQDGAQVVATSGQAKAIGGLPTTRRGEMVVDEAAPVRAVQGIGITSTTKVSVTDAG
jgi:hypothetical protein